VSRCQKLIVEEQTLIMRDYFPSILYNPLLWAMKDLTPAILASSQGGD